MEVSPFEYEQQCTKLGLSLKNLALLKLVELCHKISNIIERSRVPRFLLMDPLFMERRQHGKRRHSSETEVNIDNKRRRTELRDDMNDLNPRARTGFHSEEIRELACKEKLKKYLWALPNELWTCLYEVLLQRSYVSEMRNLIETFMCKKLTRIRIDRCSGRRYSLADTAFLRNVHNCTNATEFIFTLVSISGVW